MRKGTGIKKFLIAHPRLYKITLGRTHKKNIKLVTPAQQAVDAQDWARRNLPNDFDLYIGVPRAGLIIAETLSLLYCKPFATLQGFMRGEIFYTSKYPLPEIRKVLVCEDFVRLGRQLIKAKADLVKMFPGVEFKTGSMYVVPHSKALVDYYYKEVKSVEHWHDSMIMGDNICVDMDGVLCKNPPTIAVKSMTAYRAWVLSAEPHFVPKFKIKAIITSRPEGVRSETEDWLLRNHVRYDKLIMLSKKEQCSGQAESIEHKVRHLKQLKPKYYWESDVGEARAINKQTKIPVYCIDEMLIFGNNILETQQSLIDYNEHLKENLDSVVTKEEQNKEEFALAEL